MATVEVRLPQWGMGMLDGLVAVWLVNPGDEVSEGDDLVEIEAAKTTEVVVSPVSGVVREVLRQEGETVPVGEVVAVIDSAG